MGALANALVIAFAVERERFAALDFRHFFLQPMDSLLQKQHTRDAVAYCMAHPQWRLSVQMHKVVGIE